MIIWLDHKKDGRVPDHLFFFFCSKVDIKPLFFIGGSIIPLTFPTIAL